jgi:predicted AlkP superfamily pyrophosphatase or phosphodiesterase
MTRRPRPAVWLITLALASVLALAQQPAAPRNALLICWDGCDRNTVKELLDAGRLPNLAALIKEGSFREINIKDHLTVTKPSHAVMLTGLAPKTTGVFSNNEYQPIPEGCTAFECVQTALGKENVRVFMVTGKVAHVGGRGPDEAGRKAKTPKARRRAAKAPQGADDAPDVEKKGEPFFLTRKRLDAFDAAQRDAAAVGPLALEYLARFRSPRFFAFVHFSDPDYAGHQHGSGSREYRDAAVVCDEWLGRIAAWLSQEKLYDDTLIYVVTDHGFNDNERRHNQAPRSWLATNDKLVARGGTMFDVTPTILSRLGVDLAGLDPPLVGRPLTGQ